jgi:hypothetical protein
MKAQTPRLPCSRLQAGVSAGGSVRSLCYFILALVLLLLQQRSNVLLVAQDHQVRREPRRRTPYMAALYNLYAHIVLFCEDFAQVKLSIV